MMDKEQLLLDYFAKNLTPEQEQQFNELLSTDSEFKQQFDFEKDLQIVIRDKKSNDLKSKLIDFENERVKDVPVRTLKPNYRKWAMAASIALVVTLGWLGYNNFSGPNYSSMYEENYQEYPNTVFAITRGETIESIERDAFVAYESGNYQKAIDEFNKIPSDNREEYLTLYIGLSYLGLGDVQESRLYFDNLISSNSEYTPEALWYSALIAIKEKDKESAVNSLKALTSKYDFQKDNALELIKELE
ncbi:tetratricopeptide repeat protein [Aurantibacter sp.]|uniref:tetratricopeptide repeat protein n=1 Tax=Aurantibacter sp. TaxID=2807103 RepID=UPI003263EF32